MDILGLMQNFILRRLDQFSSSFWPVGDDNPNRLQIAVRNVKPSSNSKICNNLSQILNRLI